MNAINWQTVWPFLLALPIQIGFVVLVGWLIRKLARSRLSRAYGGPIAIAPGEWDVPVLATFAGVRGMPWWYAVAQNNARPLLVITSAGLRLRVIRLKERAFAEIEQVDVRSATLTCNLDFRFRGALLTFAANVGVPSAAGAALRLLPATVPLTPRAQAIRDAAPAQSAISAPSPSSA